MFVFPELIFLFDWLFFSFSLTDLNCSWHSLFEMILSWTTLRWALNIPSSWFRPHLKDEEGYIFLLIEIDEISPCDQCFSADQPGTFVFLLSLISSVSLWFFTLFLFSFPLFLFSFSLFQLPVLCFLFLTQLWLR